MPAARLGSISVDCADTRALAAFYAELLGGEVAFESDAFCAVKTERGWLSTVLDEQYRAPTWPDPSTPKQFHLDLAVDDLDIAEAEAIGLGATKSTTQPSPDRWRVLLDPAGHPFCVSTQIPE